MKNSNFLIYFLAILLFFSCKNDDENFERGITPSNNNPETFLQNFGNTIHRDFLGRVIDKNKNPIENVQITIGNSVAFTDTNGVFSIQNAAISERFGFVKTDKEGYIHGSRAVVPTDGMNKVTIMLLEETIAGTTQSGSQSTISLSNGASVSLNGAYVKEDGTPYDGSVNVILHHLDPTDDDMTEQMPGMLLAANAQDEAVMLKTLGMLAVELRGTSGEDLNLAENSTAEIRIPVANELLSEAPSTIPLWYFDEENGYWVEEGEAQLIGNEYIGTVTHFSFWNCDIPIRYTDICINLIDTDGNPVSNTAITLTSTTSGTTSGITNANGQVCGIIPSNETLEINVLNSCDANTPLYTAAIGPYATSTTIDIIVNTPDFITETIRGNFLDCEGNPVTDGYVEVELNNGIFIESITNGIVDFNVPRCASQSLFALNAVDVNNVQTSQYTSYLFDNDTITDIGFIYACQEIDSYMTYQIDNLPVILYTENYVIGSTTSPNNNQFFHSIGHYSNAGQLIEHLRLYYNDMSPGTYSVADDEARIYLYGDTNGSELYSDLVDNTIIMTIVSVGGIGEYIDITFSGTFTDNTGTHTITGRIYIERFA